MLQSKGSHWLFSNQIPVLAYFCQHFSCPAPCSGENPFATVKLRPTVTNDRSAPIIR